MDANEITARLQVLILIYTQLKDTAKDTDADKILERIMRLVEME